MHLTLFTLAKGWLFFFWAWQWFRWEF